MTHDMKSRLEKSWIRLSEHAVRHRVESARFNLLCEEYYGVIWDTFDRLADNDRIIDTIDYGTDTLTFEEFDKLVLSAMEEAEQAVST